MNRNRTPERPYGRCWNHDGWQLKKPTTVYWAHPELFRNADFRRQRNVAARFCRVNAAFRFRSIRRYFKNSTLALNSGVRNLSGFRTCTLICNVPFARLASGAISAT